MKKQILSLALAITFVLALIPAAMAASEFEISNGVLISFSGEYEYVEIPDGVTEIGKGAFSYSMCKSVVIPNSVTKIRNSAFEECAILKDITIPNSVTEIEFGAFFNCFALENITIPSSVTKVGNGAFGCCTYLESATILNRTMVFGDDVFIECDDLTIYGYAGSTAENYAKKYGIKFSAITGATAPTPAPSNPIDTASTWARDGITSAVAKGFVPADLQNNYTNVITRAEFCRMAVKWVEYKTGKSIDAVLSEKGVSRNANAFTDTNDTDILAAYALGITSGTGNNQFTPNGQFSREQAAAMIMNVGKVIGMNAGNILPSGFADMGSVSSWSVDGVNFCFANGIMSGTGNNQFSPKDTYTREQSILTFNNIK